MKLFPKDLPSQSLFVCGILVAILIVVAILVAALSDTHGKRSAVPDEQHCPECDALVELHLEVDDNYDSVAVMCLDCGSVLHLFSGNFGYIPPYDTDIDEDRTENEP